MSLLPLMKLRLATPTVLVDVGRVRDLSYVRDAGDHLAIGALTRHRDLETSDVLAKECGVLRAVAAQVGDNQVRHRGTIGGSVAHGDPASDLPAALLALDATFVRAGPGRRRARLRRPSSSRASSRPRSRPTSCSPRSRCRKSGAERASRTRSSTGGPRTGRSSVRSRRASNGGTHVALVNMGSTPLRATAVETALAPGRVARPTRPAKPRSAPSRPPT